MKNRSFLIFAILLFLILSFLTTNSYTADDSSKQDNIVLKALIVNPSQTIKKPYSFKYYLPQEVKPEDVINKGDLGIAYDTGRDLCYVYKDFELEPSQTITLQIVIKDVWSIPQAEIDSIRSEITKLNELMRETEFKERASFLRDSIETKLNTIIERQTQPVVSADRHILNFRDNNRTLELIKSDLAALKSLLSQTEKPISSASTWKLILGITIFLGIASILFILLWSGQIKGEAEKESRISKESIITAEKREAEEEKKVELKDIEDRLKK